MKVGTGSIRINLNIAYSVNNIGLIMSSVSELAVGGSISVNNFDRTGELRNMSARINTDIEEISLLRDRVYKKSEDESRLKYKIERLA
jgi:hypothetical protein